MLDEDIDEKHQEYMFWVNVTDWATKQYKDFYEEYDPNPQDSPLGSYWDNGYPIYDSYDYNFDYELLTEVPQDLTEDEVMEAVAEGLSDMFKSGDEDKDGSADSSMSEEEVMAAFSAGLADMFEGGDN